MRLTKVRMVFATAAALALMVGVGSAIAATGGGGLKQEAARIADRASMDAAVAKNLGTTTAKLNAAVKAAAIARIDAALAADEITATEAATLKDALADGMPAMRLATAAGVAKALGTTEAKLNAAYSDAQKAQAKARVDEALKAGNITEKYATELKAQDRRRHVPRLRRRGHGPSRWARRTRWSRDGHGAGPRPRASDGRSIVLDDNGLARVRVTTARFEYSPDRR